MNNRVTIIAEVGVNHNGDLGLAKEMIEAAAAAGADIVKFQTFNAERQVTLTANKTEYQNKNIGIDETQYSMLKRLELTQDMHYELISHCAVNNIGFLSTGFDIQSVNFLVSIGQDLIKIPSGEITNLPYLRHIGGLKKNVILSTGMCGLGDIEAAINALVSAGLLREKILVMHCTTEYPAPMSEVNLRAISNIRNAFNVAVGYSDHTEGIEVAIAAVALGATVIEKHFTLDRNLPGPDHRASLEPSELASMIKAIRNLEQALGDGVKTPTVSELRNLPFVRKSLVAKKIIKAGEIFTSENIDVKRAGPGITPMLWDQIIGTTAHQNYEVDEIIKF